MAEERDEKEAVEQIDLLDDSPSNLIVDPRELGKTRRIKLYRAPLKDADGKPLGDIAGKVFPVLWSKKVTEDKIVGVCLFNPTSCVAKSIEVSAKSRDGRAGFEDFLEIDFADDLESENIGKRYRLLPASNLPRLRRVKMFFLPPFIHGDWAPILWGRRVSETETMAIFLLNRDPITTFACRIITSEIPGLPETQIEW